MRAKTEKLPTWLVVFGLISTALMFSSCGGGGESEDDPLADLRPPSVVGSWVGTFAGTDGTGTITVTITTQGTTILPANIEGVLTQTRSGGGTTGGPVGNGSSLIKNTSGQYAMTFGVIYPSGGGNLFSGVLDASLNTMTGTYGGDVSSGTFQITRQ